MENMNEKAHEDLSRLLVKYEGEIRERISKKYEIPENTLTFLPQDEGGVYESEKTPGTFCCLVVGETDGFTYLFTGKMDKNREILSDFTADIIA
jgi:hypothetical protein